MLAVPTHAEAVPLAMAVATTIAIRAVPVPVAEDSVGPWFPHVRADFR